MGASLPPINCRYRIIWYCAGLENLFPLGYLGSNPSVGVLTFESESQYLNNSFIGFFQVSSLSTFILLLIRKNMRLKHITQREKNRNN